MIDIAQRIRDLCEANRIKSMYKLSELTQVPQSTLATIMTRSGNAPRVDTIERICTGFGITLADFFAEEQPELAPEFRRLLETAKKLTPEQREHLQKLLEAMSRDGEEE